MGETSGVEVRPDADDVVQSASNLTDGSDLDSRLNTVEVVTHREIRPGRLTADPVIEEVPREHARDWDERFWRPGVQLNPSR
jgi:hypothetical protein